MSTHIITGDALTELAKLDSGIADAVITDPPYCSGALSEAGKGRATHQGLRSETMRSGRFAWFQGDNMTTAGLSWLLRELAIEACRVLKPSGHLCVFADWRMISSVAPAMESAGLRLRNLIIWDKGHFGTGTGFRPQHEVIIHLAREAPIFHAADVGNVIRIPRVAAADRQHPTQKPVALLQKLLRVTTPIAGLVIDPFSGSGSMGLAANADDRNCILIDREPANSALARRRIADDAGLFFEATE